MQQLIIPMMELVKKEIESELRNIKRSCTLDELIDIFGNIASLCEEALSVARSWKPKEERENEEN